MTVTHASPPPSKALGDDGQIEAFLRQADITCLRAAIYQLTGDPALRALKTATAGAPADRMVVPPIEAEADRQLVQRRALDVLRQLRDGSLKVPPAPTLEEFKPLAEMFLSEPLSEPDARFWWEEFGMDPLPRRVALDNPDPKVLQDYNVLVIGAGMNGITSAVALKDAGIPFTVVEQNAGVGGTWFRNRYPGARVDVASLSYCNTFEPFYPWKHNYAVQPELIDYFKHIATKHDLWPHMRFNTPVTAMRWDRAAKVWHVDVNGEKGKETLHARFVICAMGLFGTTSFPDIAGLDSFEGRLMHTSEWDESYDVTGKRVAVIGNGSSGVQVVGALAKQQVKHLSIFQRGGAWIANVAGYEAPVPETQRWLMDNVPYYRNWLRLTGVYGVGDSYGKALDIDPNWTKPRNVSVNATNDRLRENLLGYMKSKIGHRPELLAKCIPNYPPLARRLPKDNGWYDAVLQDNVDVITTPIERITPKGIRTTDGKEHAFDLIALATGFTATEFLLSIDVQGDGTSIKEYWSKDGARAYWGMTIPHFPNLFYLYGPNTNGRAVGPAAWGEMQVRYAIKCIRNLMRQGKHAVDVKQEPYDAYNRELDKRLEQMVFSVAGQSYFWNEHGRIATNGAFYNREYFEFSHEPNMDDFNVS